MLYEIGTPDLGLAAAGYAARAQDAATVLTNPAGMTRLDKSQLLVQRPAALRYCAVHAEFAHHAVAGHERWR